MLLFVVLWCHEKTGRNSKSVGDVTTVMDQTINKAVFRLSGGRGHFLQLPAEHTTPLGLTGHYVYFQLKGMGAGRYFAIHLDVQSTAGLAVRLSFSNSFKTVKVLDRTIQFPAAIINSEAADAAGADGPAPPAAAANPLSGPGSDQRWCVFALHLPSLVGAYLPTFHYANIKGITIGADLFVRNVMTSNLCYDAQSLPRSMVLPVPKGKEFDDLYDWFWLRPPSQLTSKLPAALQEQNLSNSSIAAAASPYPIDEKKSPAPNAGSSGIAVPSSARSTTSNATSNSPNKSVSGKPPGSARGRISTNPTLTTGADEKENIRPASGNAPVINPLDLSKVLNRSPAGSGGGGGGGGDPKKAVATTAAAAAAAQAPITSVTNAWTSVAIGSTLSPDPIMQLHKVLGYTSRTTRSLLWTPDSKHAVYASNNLIVSMDMESGEQRFMLGHTAPIAVLALSKDGTLLASAQEGKQPMIRIWDVAQRKCIAYLLGLDKDVKSLTFSLDKRYLAALGRDSSGRIMIVVWKILQIAENGGKSVIAAKQVSEYSVSKLMFSPYEHDPHTLISCGYESIRFWRIKNKHLPGASVMLGQYVRNNSFTDIAFDTKLGAADVIATHPSRSPTGSSNFVPKHPPPPTILCAVRLCDTEFGQTNVCIIVYGSAVPNRLR